MTLSPAPLPWFRPAITADREAGKRVSPVQACLSMLSAETSSTLAGNMTIPCLTDTNIDCGAAARW